ncbi:DUF669 domain-containing protein [Tetragenococcus koreensis]|uniref:DUF669 domain-containing protein n=1 Tax=Tetragenococcus koreensis TaxID=290335 RepID=UPI001F1F5A30|nr:DUF669 domain-containing protein [Tetragenococcus koreensis]MCF1614807.1 DUF669 domain-containing protein [Tetragenococcus koreensis]MCF1624629.1 DUF669 domain-containing protein [Tetragenococcus koreensis]
MGLLDTLQTVGKDFDAKKDNVNQSQRLEAGNYPVRLKSAQAGQSKGGRDQISINLEVVSGENKDRQEIIFVSFDDDLPEFVLEKNGRILLKIAAMVGVEFKKKDLEDEYAASEALSKGIGQQFKMELTVSPNKKNPDFPYRNYNFEPLKDETEDDFDDEDLPF